MTMWRLALVLGLLAVAPGRAGAQEQGDPCASASANVAIGACYARELTNTNTAIETRIRERLAEVDRNTNVPAAEREKWKRAIRAAQQAFVTYRQNECSIQAFEMWGGSGAGIAEAKCAYDMGQERLRQINPNPAD
ncbi:MAG: lysozyme inhibitor LprI family protein [Phreatobacter sp.]